jgi:hypothetical protein
VGEVRRTIDVKYRGADEVALRRHGKGSNAKRGTSAPWALAFFARTPP